MYCTVSDSDGNNSMHSVDTASSRVCTCGTDVVQAVPITTGGGFSWCINMLFYIDGMPVFTALIVNSFIDCSGCM